MTPREKFVQLLNQYNDAISMQMAYKSGCAEIERTGAAVLAAYDEAARPVAAVEPFAYHWQGLFWYPEELAEEVTTVEQPIPLYVTPASNLPVADESDDRRPPGRS